MARRAHGEGHITKTEYGRWRLQYWVNGVRKSKNFATKAEASAFEATQRAAAQRGEFLDEVGGRQKLSVYAEMWLAGRDLRPTTAGKYRYLLDRHILPTLGARQLSQLRPAEIRLWYEGLRATYKSAGDDAYRLLSAILRTAQEDQLIARSPCVVKRAGQVRRSERPVLSISELRTAVDAVQPHERAILLLAVFGQLRRGEIAGLQRRDVNLKTGEIKIERTWTVRSDGKPELGPPKTDAGRRTVTLPAVALSELEVHLDRFTAKGRDAWVFSREGHPLSPRTIDRVWTRVRVQVGRPEVRLHDLRHTGLTLAARAGATTAELMVRGGHSTPAAALHYQQATRVRDRAIAEALDRLVGEEDGN